MKTSMVWVGLMTLALGCAQTPAATEQAATAQADESPRSIPLGAFTSIRQADTQDTTQLGDLQLLILTLQPEQFMVRHALFHGRSDATGAGSFTASHLSDGIHLLFRTSTNPGCDPDNANDPSIPEEWIITRVEAGGDQITVQPGQNASGQKVVMGRVTQSELAICPALGCFPRCDNGQKIVDGCPTCGCN
jgi:hypothetical protein